MRRDNGVHPDGIEKKICASTLHNFRCLGTFEFIYTIGVSFFLPLTVIPDYLLYHQVSKTLLQTVMTILMALGFLQIFGARISHHPNRKRRIVLLWALVGLPWFVYGLVAFFLGKLVPIWALIAIFILCASASMACGQLASPGYSEMMFLNITKERRGQFSSVLSFSIGFGGFLGAYLISNFMGLFTPPQNYHFAFILGATVVMLSTVLLSVMRDNQIMQYNDIDENQQLRRLAKELWGNFNFRIFLFFLSLLVAGQALAPLFIGYSYDVLKYENTGGVGYFTMSYFAGLVLIGATVPLLADRFGFRLIGVLAPLFLGCGFLLPLILPQSIIALYVAYALFASSNILGVIVLVNLGHEMIPEVPSAFIVGIGRTLVLPVILVIGPLSGLLVDVHGNAGYLAVFITGVVLSAIAVIGFLLVIREPRTGEEIYVRLRRM